MVGTPPWKQGGVEEHLRGSIRVMHTGRGVHDTAEERCVGLMPKAQKVFGHTLPSTFTAWGIIMGSLKAECAQMP